VRYTVDAVARGADLYAESCAACHGGGGRGDGPNALSLPFKPADLTQHVSHHPAGELYWMIAHGVPQRSMPAFSPAIAEKDIWNIVRYLRAEADAQEALANADTRNSPALRPIAAPDFTFEFTEQGQESLQALRGRFMTLVVFYTLPQSAERLAAIARDHHTFMREGLRIIALPASGPATPIKLEGVAESEWIFPTANANVAAAYMLFARDAATAANAAPGHAEFLIDRNGYIRARWIGVPEAVIQRQSGDRMTQLQKQVEILNTEKGLAAVVEHHGH
jgi:putative copper resistance protein D